jgi:hypothetical protein
MWFPTDPAAINVAHPASKPNCICNDSLTRVRRLVDQGYMSTCAGLEIVFPQIAPGYAVHLLGDADCSHSIAMDNLVANTRERTLAKSAGVTRWGSGRGGGDQTGEARSGSDREGTALTEHRGGRCCTHPGWGFVPETTGQSGAPFSSILIDKIEVFV